MHAAYGSAPKKTSSKRYKGLQLCAVFGGIIGSLFIILSVIFAVAPQSCTYQQLTIGAHQSASYNNIMNRGGKDSQNKANEDLYVNGLTLSVPDRYMLFPDVTTVTKNSLQVDASRSYTSDELINERSKKTSTAQVCDSPFGCPRELVTISITNSQFQDNTFSVETGDTSYDFDCSAFNDKSKVTVGNPFGFATYPGDVQDYSIRKDLDYKTKFYPGDILVAAMNGDSTYTAREIAANSDYTTSKKYTMVIVMRLNSGDAKQIDEKNMRTMNSYNWTKNSDIINNITFVLPSSDTDTGTGMKQCPITKYPYVDMTDSKFPVSPQDDKKNYKNDPNNLDKFFTTNSGDNENLNTEMNRAGIVGNYDRMYIYKLSLDGKTWLEGDAMWSAISTNPGLNSAKYEIQGLGSTLPLAYDLIYTSSDYAAAPFLQSAKVNLHDPCRQFLISESTPGFSTGDGNDGRVALAFADDIASDKQEFCQKIRGKQNSIPVLTTAAIYHYPKQTSCTDTLVFWPTDEWTLATPSHPFKDPAPHLSGWTMMATTKTVWFIVFLTFGLLLIICSIFSCWSMKKSAVGKQRSAEKDPSVMHAGFLNRVALARQNQEANQSFYSQPYRLGNPSSYNQSVHSQSQRPTSCGAPAARQWSGSRSYSSRDTGRDIEMGTYGDSVALHGYSNVPYQTTTAADLYAVPPYRPNSQLF